MKAQASFDFLVTDEMVKDFTELSGDFNPLHTDIEFGARSVYRRNIAHGMIGICQLFGNDFFWMERKKARLEKMSANFHRPLYLNETIAITLTEAKASSTSRDFKFVIEVKESKSVLTKGSFSVSYDEVTNQAEKKGSESQVHSKNVDEYYFDDIEEKSQASFKFDNNSQKEKFLWKLFKAKSQAFSEGEWLSHFNPESLIATSILSSYVGMKLPGKHATFLGFNVHFSAPKLHSYLTWNGVVTVKSESTSSIFQDLTLCDSHEAPLAKASVSAKIQRKGPAMAGAKEIFQSVNRNDLENKVVIVTGGSRGLGETISKLCAAHKMKVVVNYHRSHMAAENLVQEINEAGGLAIAYKADVSDRDQVQKMVDFTLSKFGRVDVVVNNAVRDALSTPFLEQTWKDVQAEIDVSLQGAFNLCQAVLPHMKEQESGSIINIGTVSTEVPPPQMYKYVMVKSALVGMTRSLAVEFAPYNIRVNSVSPSLMETDLTQSFPLDYIEEYKANTPMGRSALPLEVARAVVFLASEMSSFTTGQRLVVSGGNAPFI
jgi:3-oxoacyl-[acyl-carrier protein] reductase